MKITIKFAALIVLLNIQLFSQAPGKAYLDSLFSKFAVSRFLPVEKISAPGAERVLPEKCLTFTAYESRKNLDYFTSTQQALLKPMLSRPETDTSLVTPKGYFRVHFYKSGSEVPKYDMKELSKALDSAYDFEVNFLKFQAPPKDNGEGGDDLYDVYVTNLGNGYGYTQFNTSTDEVSPGSNTFRSYMMIDDDYNADVFPSAGIAGARVTVAHEFHHAIQIGGYYFREADRYFLELTSTSMEEFVCPDVNDYFNYLSTYFRRPYRCFARNNVSSGDGYDLAIWNIFLQKKFGYDIIKREWELIKKYKAIEAVDKALQEYSSTFIEAYNEFGLWCYFTNYRAVKGKYFDDAEFYPLLTPFYKLDFYSPYKTVTFSTDAATNTHLYYINTPQIDTLMIVCTNGDVQAALNSQSGSSYSCEFSLFDFNNPGSKQISSSYYSKLSATGSSWLQGQILNGAIVQGDSTSIPTVSYPFPSPFSYKKNVRVYMPITNADIGAADVNIYTASMSLVYSATQMIDKYIDKKVIKWDAKDNSGNKLASGIYIYAIKTKNSTITGKLAIIND